MDKQHLKQYHGPLGQTFINFISNTPLEEKKKPVFILKPEASSQGRGIYLVTNPIDVPIEERCIVQRYITDPFLVDGLKFDLRIYVLVLGCDP
jgi:glutathione synthase/RimK-type ligase-like ATP-grasp enzyme